MRQDEYIKILCFENLNIKSMPASLPKTQIYYIKIIFILTV